MNKSRIDALIDICMFAAFVVCIYSAFVLQSILGLAKCIARTPDGGFSNVLHLGLGRGQWAHLHIASGWVFTILIIMHLVMHLKWIKKIPSYFKSST